MNTPAWWNQPEEAEMTEQAACCQFCTAEGPCFDACPLVTEESEFSGPTVAIPVETMAKVVGS